MLGDLGTLRDNAGFGATGEILTCKGDNLVSTAAIVVEDEPAPGEALFVLVRSAEHCNERAGGSWGQVGENTDVGGPRDAGINPEADVCPE